MRTILKLINDSDSHGGLLIDDDNNTYTISNRSGKLLKLFIGEDLKHCFTYVIGDFTLPYGTEITQTKLDYDEYCSTNACKCVTTSFTPVGLIKN